MPANVGDDEMKKSARNGPLQVLLHSIDSAIGGVTKSKAISDKRAHSARKLLKKARAALRLLRPTIGDVVYRRENTALRDAARSISRLRDAKAQADIVASLRKRHPKQSATGWIALESKALERLEHLRNTLHEGSPPVRAAIRMMRASRRRLSALSRRTVDAKDVDGSLRRIYRQSRKAFAVAKRRPATVLFHEWRKRTKYFANAVDVLGKRAPSRAGALAKDAARLGDWLGEEHDLAVLANAVRRDRRALTAHAKERLRKTIDARRAKLQKKALRLGETLHGKKPNEVVT